MISHRAFGPPSLGPGPSWATWRRRGLGLPNSLATTRPTSEGERFPLTESGLPSLFEPSRSLPSPARPCRALPSPAAPSLALPSLAEPCRALSGHGGAWRGMAGHGRAWAVWVSTWTGIAYECKRAFLPRGVRRNAKKRKNQAPGARSLRRPASDLRRVPAPPSGPRGPMCFPCARLKGGA